MSEGLRPKAPIAGVDIYCHTIPIANKYRNSNSNEVNAKHNWLEEEEEEALYHKALNPPPAQP